MESPQKTRSKVWIIDPVCPKPYTAASLATTPLGGTEATVIRVAEGLSPHYDITVSQHCFQGEDVVSPGGVRYCATKPGLYTHRWHSIVVLRDFSHLQFLRAKQPSTPLYAWLHDVTDARLCYFAKALERTRTTAVCVSDWHRTQTIEALRVQIETPKVVKIYNPIDDALSPGEAPVNPHKLVFFSSPHKGLAHALDLFARLRHFDSRFILGVANPGYITGGVESLPPGVDYYGPLVHDRVLEHVKSSLGCFHLNHVFPETFGLVTAESNACGTPVLTSALGANPEIVSSPDQLIDTRDYKAVIERILKWSREGRRVVGKPEFRLSRVVDQWRKLLG